MTSTRHRISGLVELDTPQHVIDHPVLGKYLEIVDEDAKSIPPEVIQKDIDKAEKIAADSKKKNDKKDDK